MSLELYEKILGQVKHFARRIVFHLFGEPLLHPHLPQMISMAKKYNIKTSLHTNASVLTEEKSEDILNSGLDVLVFSFNGGEFQEEYEKISPKNVYPKVIKNIKYFLELKKKRGLNKPFTAFEIIKIFQPGKEFSISREFKNIFSGLPVDRFSGGWAHHWAENFKENMGMEFDRPASYYAPCQHLWNELAICWDGTVVACCNDMQRTFPLGNVTHESIRAIWNGAKMCGIREKLVKKQYEQVELCRNCDRLWADKSEPNPVKRIIKKAIFRFAQSMRNEKIY